MKKLKLFFIAIFCLQLTVYVYAQQNITKYIKTYFNQPVDNSFSKGVNALRVRNAIMDTIAAYINRAKYTVDVAVYDYDATGTDTLSHIATAINNAYKRGVKIRWIHDANISSTGLTLLNSNIPVLASPDGGACYTDNSGIMHNKFVIIDAWDSLHAIVSTGSEDWSEPMNDFDYNNLVFIQSKVLARAYTNEFNIMWGDTTHGAAPNASKEEFGICKPNSGTHIFHIGGSEIDLYFSPSDNVNTYVVNAINSSDTDMYCGMYTFTTTTYSSPFVSRNNAGVYTSSIIDQFSSGYASYTAMSALPNFVEYTGSAIYHNKYAIINPSNPCGDPKVVTGSMNWSAAAYEENDENTIIIHNDTIANLYLQSYAGDYEAISHKTLKKHPGCSVAFSASANVNNNSSACAHTGEATASPDGGTSPYTYLWNTTPAQTTATATGLSAGTYTVTVKDKNGNSYTTSVTITAPASINMTKNTQEVGNAKCNGSAWVGVSGGTSPYTYSWSPGGNTTDSISGQCKGTYCCTVTDADGCKDSICVSVVTGIDNISNPSAINIYPDPNTGYYTITGVTQGQVIELYNYLGQKMNRTIADGNVAMHFNISAYQNGIYLIRIENSDGTLIAEKKMVKMQ